MKLTQLRALASEPDSGPFRLQRFTREDARELLADVEALIRSEVSKVELFDQFQPKDKDDGKYVNRLFGKIHAVGADEQRIFEETGNQTIAAINEGGCYAR